MKKTISLIFFYSFVIFVVFFIYYQETRKVNNDIHSNNNEQYNEVENSIDNNSNNQNINNNKQEKPEKKEEEKEKTIIFKLIGNSEINIYEGDTYTDSGYVLKDENDNNLNYQVKIVNNVQNTKVGSYTYEYNVEIDNKKYNIKRKVNVLNNPIKNIELKLKGKSNINILVNENFVDPLFECIDKSTNKDLSKNVKVTSNLNNKKTGSYTIKYTIEISGKQKTITRNINVLSKKHTFKYNNQLTNKNVTITFQSHIPNFSYIMDPSNKTYKQSNITYTVANNGTYKFIVYDTENGYEEYQINIKNIDKIAPTISSCNGTISNNKTLFEITGQSSDTAKFVINNIEFTKNTQIINSSLENATVDVYDKTGNKKSYICNSIYNPINPVGTENVIKKGVTDTLRVWIEKKNRSSRTSYYVTHIWAKNPYSQFKMQVPNNFGKELITANNLLLNATNQNGYSNKLIIAINASGFIKNGTFGQTFYDANKDWDLTGRSPLVIVNGKKLRDISNSTIPITIPVFGLKSNGLLAYYNYKAGNNLEYNINLSKKIINEGVKSTFSFGPVLVYDSTKKNNATDQNIRQAMCQIDKNNFVFISDEYSTPRTGFSYSELADYMLSLGCKIGFNLDGGGSVSLVYKSRQSNPTIITGSTREIADIIYFHE